MKADTARAPSGKKFIQTFLIYQAKGPTLRPGDEHKLAKYDILYFGRFRYNEVNGDTWGAVRALNPNVLIYLYQQGPDVWRNQDNNDVARVNNIVRYDNARGHSMGNLNADNPDLFLLQTDGSRCHTYGRDYRYLMDFGSPKFHDYWLEASCTDIVEGPWVADGIFIDNTSPQQWGYACDTPAKYDTDEKWGAAMHEFQMGLTKGLRARGQKVWTNTCCSLDPFGFEAWIDLDNGPHCPDLLAEEGAFCHGWDGGGFYSEQQWRRQVDIMGRLKNCGITIFSHIQLNEGESGTDNFGKPVTYFQALWYALASFLLGKNDELNNAYFFFFPHTQGYRGLWWYDEYERIDLGKAVGTYERVICDGVGVYRRQFVDGYVYVNPTADDAGSIPLPEPCKQLTHENINQDPKGFQDVETIDLKSHHSAILVKSAEV